MAMKIEVKLHCKDITGEMREGIYELPDQCTVDEALAAVFSEAGKTLTENIQHSLVFMVNGKPAVGSMVLNDGDKLRVLFKILGG